MNKAMLILGVPDLPMRAFQPLGGQMSLFKSDSADTRGMNEAAVRNAQLGQDALNWFKDYVAKTEPDRQAAATRANAVSDAQLEAMNFATQQAKDLDTRNKTVFQPLEDQIVADSSNYDTAARRSQASSEARSDVEQAYGSAQQGLQRNLMRMGVTPGSGRSMTLMQSASLDKAKALAGATTGAVKNVEAQGYARKMDAVGLGKGIVGSQATQQQIATQAGGASTASANTAMGAATSAGSLMNTGFNNAMQGNQSAGNLYGQIAQINASSSSANNSALMGGIGGIAQGVGAFFGSSKEIKTPIRKMGGDEASAEGDPGEEKALKGLKRMQVDEWKYKPGVADEGVHVGPYAEDMQREFGDEAAPGGKVINAHAAKDINLQAIRAMASKLRDMESEIAELQAA